MILRPQRLATCVFTTKIVFGLPFVRKRACAFLNMKSLDVPSSPCFKELLASSVGLIIYLRRLSQEKNAFL